MNTTETKKSKGLHVGLWISQGLLAAMFLMAGLNKTFQSIEELAKMLPWVTDVSPGLVRFIGISELLGGIGLIVPSLLRIKPKLTAYAAIGLALIMLFATVFHLSKGEANVIAFNFILMALAVFVAWGRLKKSPINPK